MLLDVMWHSRHSSLTSLDVITLLYAERCLKTKEPLCWEQYNIYINAWKKRPFVLRTIQYLHRCLKKKTLCVEKNTILTQYQNCCRTGDFPLLMSYSPICLWRQNAYNSKQNRIQNIITFIYLFIYAHYRYSRESLVLFKFNFNHSESACCSASCTKP